MRLEGMLRLGTELISEAGLTYKVCKYLGAGGQGEVYDVSVGNEHYALKWYFLKSATRVQKEIIDNLIEKGSPGKCFLWPQDMIFEEYGKSFGYIMPLRPKEYRSIVDLMKRKAEPSFYALCKAAYNLVRGYQLLHQAGWAYCDINFENVFFNPENGDVLICDNDNASPNGTNKSGVLGTPRFMAPEIVVGRGKVKPKQSTDRYSLAVLLFYMFMINHPLEGKKEASIRCMDIPAMEKIYGEEPVFIFDPDNDSNRPLPGYQDNATLYWEVYPQELRDLFTKTFTEGLKNPSKRIPENVWLKTLTKMLAGITYCQSCGAEIFYDAEKEKNSEVHCCWNCSKNVKIGTKMVIGKNRIMISSDTKLFSHYINEDYDMETVVGEIVVNPNNPTIWGVKNKTSSNWTYQKSDGTQVAVGKEKAATIAKDVRIDFGNTLAEFE